MMIYSYTREGTLFYKKNKSLSLYGQVLAVEISCAEDLELFFIRERCCSKRDRLFKLVEFVALI